jgi:hypothetical protein
MSPANLGSAVETFRREAAQDSQSAFSRRLGPTQRARFAAVVNLAWSPEHPDGAPDSVGRRAWKYFFETSIASVLYTAHDSALVAFYNPWADSAVVTAWKAQGGRATIWDAEILAGDFLRKAGQPPFAAVPPWQQGLKVPVLAAAEGTAETLRAFRRTFAPLAVPAPERTARMTPDEIEALSTRAAGWRTHLRGLENPKVCDGNYLAAGMMLKSALGALDRFFGDEVFAAPRDHTYSLLRRLQAGRLAEVLAVATGTLPEARRALAQEMSGKWNQTSAVAFGYTEKLHFLFMQPTGDPSIFVCFVFRERADSERWSLWRIDFVNHEAVRRELNTGR